MNAEPAKFGRESRFRNFENPPMRFIQRLLLWAIPVMALLFNFDLPSHLGTPMIRQQYLGIILVLVLSSVFLSRPASLGSPREKVPWYDIILTLLSVVVGAYLIIYYPQIVSDIGELSTGRAILGTLALLLVMEACRRMTGWILVIISALFIFYAYFAFLFPGILYAKGTSWTRIAIHLYIDPNSLLGIPLSIVSTIVIAFILFGQVLFAMGGGDFFTDLATSLLGRFRGGAAKMALVSSALFGTISGSPVGNVVMTGTISIPLMKRTGYKPHVAAAVESVASTGGQLMPPVMGAAAFVMAEFLGMSYGKVAIAALVPAALYYLALFIQVDLEAGKTGITRIEEKDIPSFLAVLKNGWIFIIPILVIIYLLFFMNLNAAKAGFYAAAVSLAISFLRRNTRINFKKFMAILEETGRTMLEVAVVCSVAGVVIGILTLTGLAFIFTLIVEQMGSANIMLILFMTALVALILGMGMPTTAVYVIVALTLAPAITKLGILPIAAHLFVFYWAMLSLFTPPICIAAFAAAAVSGTSAMRTGVTCMRLGIIAYLVPFVMVFDPLLLLQGPAPLVILAIATAAAGTIAIGIAMSGYLFRSLKWGIRIILTLGGIGLLIPPGGTIQFSWAINLVGAAVCLLFFFYEWQAKKKVVVD
ncbi:TRAP transporter permease [Thermodesulfobacteriota bacterium]